MLPSQKKKAADFSEALDRLPNYDRTKSLVGLLAETRIPNSVTKSLYLILEVLTAHFLSMLNVVAFGLRQILQLRPSLLVDGNAHILDDLLSIGTAARKSDESNGNESHKFSLLAARRNATAGVK